jgi:hypothetical protein
MSKMAHSVRSWPRSGATVVFPAPLVPVTTKSGCVAKGVDVPHEVQGASQLPGGGGLHCVLPAGWAHVEHRSSRMRRRCWRT